MHGVGDTRLRILRTLGCQKKSNRFDDLTGFHLKVPRVRVVIRDPTSGRRHCVEKEDDHVAVGTETFVGWDERPSHPGIGEPNRFIEKFLLALISLRQGR